MLKKFLFSFLLLISFQTLATTLVYKAIGGKHEEFFQTYTIEKTPTGQLVKLLFTEKGEKNREHEVTFNQKNETIKWKFKSYKSDLTIDAYKEGDQIVLDALKKEKKIHKVFPLKGKLWMQIFPTGLEHFALSNEKDIELWSLGVEGQAELEIAEFILKRKDGEQLLKVDQSKENTHTFILTFNDWKSHFWKGKTFHRKSDGRVLAIEIGRDIGTWQLISEK